MNIVLAPNMTIFVRFLVDKINGFFVNTMSCHNFLDTKISQIASKIKGQNFPGVNFAIEMMATLISVALL